MIYDDGKTMLIMYMGTYIYIFTSLNSKVEYVLQIIVILNFIKTIKDKDFSIIRFKTFHYQVPLAH